MVTSMKMASFEEFKAIYQKKVRTIYEYWTPQMQTEMSLHCHGWDPRLFDINAYLQASVIRYYTAYRSFAGKGRGLSICDVGGFWGVFPITLKELGYEVSLTESLKYYGSSFERLFHFIISQGVRVLDYDPFELEPTPGRYDIVLVMAVLEHYPHSLKVFMTNLVSMMEDRGGLYIEVPNIAYWPKRLGLLRGRTPLAEIQDIYRSEVPFIGHHHEFTLSELRRLAHLSDLTITREFFYTYSATDGLRRRLWSRPVETITQMIWPKTRECIAIFCEKASIEIQA